jgi:cytochrome c-type biogenesis protein CcmF
MENLGSLAILLAFCLALYATAACVIGRLKNKPFLIVSGERAVYGIWALIATASGILVYSLITSDFRFAYVAEHSNRTMPVLYTYAAGGADRKARCCEFPAFHLLLGCGLHNRRKHRDMMPCRSKCDDDPVVFPVLNNLSQTPSDAGGGQADHVGARRQRTEPLL